MGAYYVTRTHPQDRDPGGFARVQAIVAGPFADAEGAGRRARELDTETRAQGRQWQETTGLPMPWTNGTVAFASMSAVEIDRGRAIGVRYEVDADPYPVLPPLDDWDRLHSVGEIRRQRSYLEPTSDASWDRFVSADRRFPVSFEMPRGWEYFYDFNRAESLFVDLGDWSVDRDDLHMLANRDARAREVVANPGRLLDAYSRWRGSRAEELAPMRVGSSDDRYPRLRWPDGAEWVLCLGTDAGLWRFVKPAYGNADTFDRMLGSVRWLDDAFFEDLDRHQAR